MSRAENALMRLYEDADLRDELTDDEADQMLKWAETELTRLDASGVDDSAFESQVDTLLKMLKKINRFAGRQGQFSAQANDQAPGNIAALATELGHPASAEQVAAAGTGDPSSTLTALINLMNTASEAAVTDQAAPVPDQPVAFPEATPDQAAPSEPALAETVATESVPVPDQPVVLPEATPDQAAPSEPALAETVATESAPVPDQPAPPPEATPDQAASSPDQPPADSPDIPFGAYIDEYDL